MNLIVGNAAGTFSTILNYLAWMSIESIPDNNISLNFHWANKTDFFGNTFYWYKKVKSDQVHKSLLERPNLINYFFNTKKNNLSEPFEEYIESYPSISTDLISDCPEFVWKGCGGSSISMYDDTLLLSNIRREYNKQWNKLIFSNDIQSKLNNELKILTGEKILTAMIRYTGHYIGANEFLESTIEQIKFELEKYDKVLLLTQVQEVFDIFTKIFGDRCIFPERKRILGDIDWKGGMGECMSDVEYVQEVKECLIDVFLASQTSHIISGASNMFLGALIINPRITYEIFDSLKPFNGA